MEEVYFLWLISVTSVLCCIIDREMQAKTGDDVTLHCEGPKDTDISVLKWKRSDLVSEDYIFFYRENRLYQNYQYESYLGRVELKDQDMKDGDFSVILKDVTIRDNGTYKCYVGISGSYPKVFSIVHLKVIPGYEAGHTEDDRKNDRSDDKGGTHGETMPPGSIVLAWLFFQLLLLFLFGL